MKSQDLSLGEFLKRYAGSDLKKIRFHDFLKIVSALSIESFKLIDLELIFSLMKKEKE